jgi:hypothetical protein
MRNDECRAVASSTMMNARHVSSMRMDKHTMGERKASASTRDDERKTFSSLSVDESARLLQA